jgi:hypothetical protein
MSISVRADFIGTHQQRLSPFVLSLSKYERTLQAVNGLSNLPFDRLPSASSASTPALIFPWIQAEKPLSDNSLQAAAPPDATNKSAFSFSAWQRVQPLPENQSG